MAIVVVNYAQSSSKIKTLGYRPFKLGEQNKNNDIQNILTRHLFHLTAWLKLFWSPTKYL